jgi:hypothetical protein
MPIVVNLSPELEAFYYFGGSGGEASSPIILMVNLCGLYT